MLIGKINHDPKRQVSITLPESTIVRLDRYKDLYEETHGSNASSGDIMNLMLNALMDKDRAFRSYERRIEKEEKREERASPSDGRSSHNHHTNSGTSV